MGSLTEKEKHRAIAKRSAAKVRASWTPQQKKKHNEESKKYRDGHKKERHARELQRKFGISIERYNEMFASQKGCCAICGRHQSELKKRLHVDHDHETDEVRGLLCSQCNAGIGFFEDSKELLEMALHYLQKDP